MATSSRDSAINLRPESHSVMLMFFFSIAGAAALLIYAVRMVRTGVERAFAIQLRRWLRASARNRGVAAGSGALVALLMQSATAVAVLAAGFITAGSISGSVGLAMLLGADVGSALVVQALVLRPEWLAPLLLFFGVATFLRSEAKPGRQVGRILVGLALIFVALDMIAQASGPLRDHDGLAAAAAYLRGDPITAFVIGAVLTWLIHSSVAAILLLMIFAGQGLVPPETSLAMVLGANLGGSLIAVGLTLGADSEARRMVWANVLLRGGGAALALTAMTVLATDMVWLGSTAQTQVINLHLLFNIGVAIIGLPLVPPLLKAMAMILPTPASATPLNERSAVLDPQALADPERALACATREILHMGETVEAMLRPTMKLFSQWDQNIATGIAEAEMRLDKMNLEVKAYLAQVVQSEDESDLGRRVAELVEQAAHFEAAGDAIARMTFGLARKMRSEALSFSSEGQRELADFHDMVLTNAQAALHVQMTRNPESARALVAEKEWARHLEQKLHRTHLTRLQEANADSIATSSLHQETLRELKQINTCFIMVAYPILTESGDLLKTRLKHTG